MSAKTGDALDHDSGIISFLLETLRSAANALFGHPVDVSPVGHFAEFFLLIFVKIEEFKYITFYKLTA